MFTNDCKKSHRPNYEESCCLRHLVMMNDFAENQLNTTKYAKLLFKTLNHHFKLNNLIYENIKFDILKILLEILSKYISYFYTLNKNDYTKILIKIALNASTKNEYSEHPDILIRKVAILNNLACIYQAEKKFSKAVKYFKFALNDALNNLDRAMIYNNLTKIYIDSNDTDAAMSSLRCCYESFKEEAERLKLEKMKNAKNDGDVQTIQKANLIAFLYYNYGIVQEKFGKNNEATSIFNKGLKFAVTILGENNLLTLRFRPKVYERTQRTLALSSNSIESMRKKRFMIDSLSGSDYEDMTVTNNYSTNYLTRDTSNKPRISTKENNQDELGEVSTMLNNLQINEGENNYDKNNANNEVFERSDEKIRFGQKVYQAESSKNTNSNSNNTNNINTNLDDARRHSEIVTKKFANRQGTIMDICASDIERRKSSPFGKLNIRYTLRPSISKILNKENQLPYNEFDISQLIKEFKREAELSPNSGVKQSQTQAKLDLSFKTQTKEIVDRDEIALANMNKSYSNLEIFGKKQMKRTTEKRETATFVKYDNSNYEIPVKNYEEDINHLTEQAEQDRTPQLSTEGPELKELIEKETKNKRRKPRGLKDMLSMVVNSNSKTNKPNKIEQLLKSGNLFGKSNFNSDSKADKYFTRKNPSHEQPKINTNEYDALMSKIENEDNEFVIEAKEHTKSKLNILDSSLIGVNNMKKEEVKQELVVEMKKYNFQIAIDESNDDYNFETLFVKDDRPREARKGSNTITNVNNSNVSLHNALKEVEKLASETTFTFGKDKNPRIKANRKVTEYFKQMLKSSKKLDLFQEKSSQNLIENEIDYHFLDDENNYYRYRKKEEINFTEFFDNLITNHIDKGKIISALRKIDDDVMKIVASFGMWGKDKGISLRLFKGEILICENFIFFDKISNFLQKICVLKILPCHVDLNSLGDLDQFLEKVLINLCYPIFNEETKTPSIAILRKPAGVFAHKAYEFSFLSVKCSIDIVLLDGKFINMFVFSLTDMKCLHINIDCDEECFDLLFKLIPDECAKVPGEKLLPSYYFADYLFMSKNGLIPKMIIRIQEILRNKMIENKIEDANFHTFVNKFPCCVIKIQLRNELKNNDLWMINYEDNYKWVVNYYTLDKLEISNNLIYISKNFVLDEQDYINIVGVDPKDNLHFLSRQEMIITNNLLLNTVKLRNINTKILTEKNYDAMIKITRISPISILRYSHSLKHNKHYFIVSFEFLVYSRTCFYIKILITETHTCRTYSKLFLPFFMYSNKFDPDELKKELETQFKITKRSLEDPIFKEKIKNVANEWASSILQKHSLFNQYESLDLILEKL